MSKNTNERANWKSWRDIKDWAQANGYKHLAARMQLNNDCWNSSGEFGRCQVEICDRLRLCADEDLHGLAKAYDKQMAQNYGLW